MVCIYSALLLAVGGRDGRCIMCVFFFSGQQVYRGSNQTKGVTMVPKRAMNVMSCEIVRLLQLTQNAIIPISYHVQRKVFLQLCICFQYD